MQELNYKTTIYNVVHGDIEKPVTYNLRESLLVII